MEVETGVAALLMQNPDVMELVKGNVGKYRLLFPVDGNGGIGVRVWKSNGWATPDPVGTFEYPIVVVDVVADPTRGAGGAIVNLDAETRAYRVARKIRDLLNDLRDVKLSKDLYIARIARGSEPRLVRASDQHPPEEGDTVTVRVEFNVGLVRGRL